jgi:hypothetical protein
LSNSDGGIEEEEDADADADADAEEEDAAEATFRRSYVSVIPDNSFMSIWLSTHVLVETL